MDIRISVIVPVYKAEAYLSGCVDSILAQSYENFELILVDDGSPDGSGALCDSYAARDARVKVLHKENGGVSSARNAGLDSARGTYVVFIDSDDYAGPDYLKALVGAVADDDTLIISDYQPFHEQGEDARTFYPEFCADLSSGKPEDFRKLIFDFRLFPPYCKLYRRDIIEANDIRFDTEMRTAEDFDFNMRYIEHVKRVRYIASVQYYYRVGYKAYVPSNGGVLGHSEIKSAHTMARGMAALAERMGCREELEDELCVWAAKKHYFNRLPMLFAENPGIGYWKRKKLYNQLLADETYRALHRRGIGLTESTTTKKIGTRWDCFFAWWLFFGLNRCRRNRRNNGA
jgi:glycosyltransferase involved in cell wall biosynthesis